MKTVPTSPWLLGFLAIALLLCLSVIFYSKQPPADSSIGFVLPPGDVERGKQVFFELDCVKCHTVEGVDFANADPLDANSLVPLGGEIPEVKTYGQLATAIMHPSESIRSPQSKFVNAQGESLMPDYKTTLTVEQLSHLVHFLSERYEVHLPRHEFPETYYPYGDGIYMP